MVFAQGAAAALQSLYAYCRISDDLGDEVGDTAVALALLELWGKELDACYDGAGASSGVCGAE